MIAQRLVGPNKATLPCERFQCYTAVATNAPDVSKICYPRSLGEMARHGAGIMKKVKWKRFRNFERNFMDKIIKCRLSQNHINKMKLKNTFESKFESSYAILVA